LAYKHQKFIDTERVKQLMRFAENDLGWGGKTETVWRYSCCRCSYREEVIAPRYEY
jgi:hypothetical protein